MPNAMPQAVTGINANSKIKWGSLTNLEISSIQRSKLLLSVRNKEKKNNS
jgi:hypothetical protein